MRIVSLLPSLTELVCALGRGDELVGVTHECDFPPGVELLPHLTHSTIPADATASEIDRMVAEQGGSLYRLDAEALAELRPDLILTQEQCDVCAVNEATVRRVAAGLPGHPRVESVNPTDLGGVLAMFRRIGEIMDATDSADTLLGRFEDASWEIEGLIGNLPRPSVAVLEWVDPPFSSGHWTPKLVELAGGVEAIAREGERSRRLGWDEVARADPDLILVAACGFGIDRTTDDLAALADRPEWRGLRAVVDGRVAVTDGSAYFSRPGPRLVESLRIAAAAIHPDLCGGLAPEGSLSFVPRGG